MTGTYFFFFGYLTGKTGDTGDRTEFYVLKFYVPFLLPRPGRLTQPVDPEHLIPPALLHSHVRHATTYALDD